MRSRASPWHLPDAPLRIRFIVASGAGILGVAGLAWIARPWLQAGARYPLHALAVFAAMMVVAVAAAVGTHPFPRLGPANHVTMVRAMLVALVAGVLLEPATMLTAWWVVGAAAVIAALDGVDGWLARRTRMSSVFGARFDMETDALLIMVLALLVWRHEKAGAWVLACGLMRYAFAAAGWLWPWFAGPLRPTRRGKIVAVGQVLGLSAALAPAIPTAASTIVAAVTLATLAWSFAIDVGRLWRQQAAGAP